MDIPARAVHDDHMASLRLVAVTLVAMSAAMLTGCVQYTTYADLEGERDAADHLPELEEYAYDSLDALTSRFVGEHNGTSLWLAKGEEANSACLVAQRGDDWIIGCGGGMSGGPGSFEIYPDGAVVPEGATQVSENVYAW